MLLQELSQRSGVSVASIKYYRREGLLPPGRPLTATRFDYGHLHLDRLALIQGMRTLAGASIAAIRVLCECLDDPARPLLEALEIAQAITLGIDLEQLTRGVPPDEDPRVRALLDALDWPDVSSGARLALDATLREMAAQRIPLGGEDLLRYARPLGEIAAADLASLRADAPEGVEAAASVLSPDEIVRRSVAGSLASARLLVVLRALGHASQSVIDAGRSRTPDGSAPPHAG